MSKKFQEFTKTLREMRKIVLLNTNNGNFLVANYLISFLCKQ